MVYKDYKIDAEFLCGSAMSSKYNQLSEPRTLPVLLPIIISPSIMFFPNNTLSQLSYCIFYQILIIHSLVNYLLLFKFIQIFCTWKRIITEDDILIISLCFNDFFFKLLFRFHAVSKSILNSLASWNNVINVLLLIYFFRNLQLDYKKIAFFTPQYIHHHHLNHSCCMACFLHQFINTLQHIPEDGSFYLICR